MSHQVESMMYSGETPWHGLGTAVKGTPTIEEGIKAAGLDWEVGLKPLQLEDGRHVPAFATVRASDNKILGVVGPNYHVLQNHEAFAWFQPFLDAKQASLHTAGSLRGGTRVWVLAHVTKSQTEVVKGDRVDAFILLSHGHDGTMAVRCGWTGVRVVCANTLALAHGDSGSKLIRVRHTASMKDNLAAIRDVMDAARQEFVATVTQYRRLAHAHINQSDVKKYVRQVLGAKDDDDSTDSTRFTNMVREAMMLVEHGRGSNIPGVRGTMWGAYNGITEYLSWSRGANADKRMDSLWFSSGAQMNKTALDLALQMAT